MVLFISELSAKPGSAQYQWEPILLSRDRAAESTESNKSIWRSLYPWVKTLTVTKQPSCDMDPGGLDTGNIYAMSEFYYRPYLRVLSVFS